jgi:antitoxin (DNA-binding transcriptional repressor) of toxin-antitoxin stability system
MYKLPLKEAETKLAELISKAASGEDVIITRDDGTAFKIIPTVPQKRRIVGIAKGSVWMSEDFDKPLEDFEEYMS